MKRDSIRFWIRSILVAVLAFSVGRFFGGGSPAGTVAVAAPLIVLLGLTLFPKPVHRYVMDDHTFVAIVLLTFSIIMGALTIVFFSVKIQNEFAAATFSVASWLDELLQQEEIQGVISCPAGYLHFDGCLLGR